LFVTPLNTHTATEGSTSDGKFTVTLNVVSLSTSDGKFTVELILAERSLFPLEERHISMPGVVQGRCLVAHGDAKVRLTKITSSLERTITIDQSSNLGRGCRDQETVPLRGWSSTISG
jgi:hypothetical protein